MKKTIEAQRVFYDAMYRHRSDAQNIDQLCRLHVIRSFLRKLPPARRRILELGCGTGWLSHELSRFGQVTAVDLSPEAIKIAQATHPAVQFHAANFLEDPILTQAYDLVVASEVLEHLRREDQLRFIRLAHERLGRGGFLILTTPNRPVVARFSISPQDLQPIENWLTIDELRSLLQPFFQLLALRTTLFSQPFLRRHPFLNWLRYVCYCRLKALAVTENLLGWLPYGTYICCLAQKN